VESYLPDEAVRWHLGPQETLAIGKRKIVPTKQGMDGFNDGFKKRQKENSATLYNAQPFPSSVLYEFVNFGCGIWRSLVLRASLEVFIFAPTGV
jgi:hypothetical protein